MKNPYAELELRHMIREELMHGVPEFMIRQATDDCVARVKQHIKRFIQFRAENPTHARELHQAANESLKELDDEMYALIEDKLWAFLQKT